MIKKVLILLAFILFLGGVGVATTRPSIFSMNNPYGSPLTAQVPSPAHRATSAGPIVEVENLSTTTEFIENFSTTTVIEEERSPSESSSSHWWLSSGGEMRVEGGVGKTIAGDLSVSNSWRRIYAVTTPIGTDLGKHPQNIFRVVQKGVWKDFTQEVYFKIAELNLSASPDRNESNGVLLFNRYQDANTLYYVGLRVDGGAVIKKKINGVYYTLAYTRPFQGNVPYNRDTNPNLLPVSTWIGLRSEIKTEKDAVSIALYVDVGKTGKWLKVAEALDKGTEGEKILNGGHAGIRSDFMDVLFDDYKISEI